MKIDARGTTDVLSSLPIIACCIFAVMLLVAAMGQSSNRIGEDGGMQESCDALLGEALKNMTVRSEDGRRYLDIDWSARAMALSPANPRDGPVSSAVEVRLLGADPSNITLSGDIVGCREVFSAGAPVLLVVGNECIPGEIVARVGR